MFQNQKKGYKFGPFIIIFDHWHDFEMKFTIIKYDTKEIIWEGLQRTERLCLETALEYLWENQKDNNDFVNDLKTFIKSFK
jgi:hypothetical protein